MRCLSSRTLLSQHGLIVANGKKQLSSGLLEMSGPGRAPIEQTFFKPPSDAADENSSTTQRSLHAVGTK